MDLCAIGARIKTARERAGLTQEDLAAELEMSPTHISVLERGLKATDVTAMALAMDNNMPMVCFGLAEENSIVRVVRGEKIGTTVTN